MTVTVKRLRPRGWMTFSIFSIGLALSTTLIGLPAIVITSTLPAARQNGPRDPRRKIGKRPGRGFCREKMAGYLAYLEDSPVGWCNANDKRNYARLAADKNLGIDPREKVGSIVCFVIGPQYRRRGIAKRLLEEACAGFEKKGYACAEGLPPKKGVERRAALSRPVIDVSASRV